MEKKFYGVGSDKIVTLDRFQVTLEEISIKGYSVIEDVLTADEVSFAASRLDEIYAAQAGEFGEEKMKAIKEANLARCPLAYDEFFLKIATQPAITDIVKHFLGDYFIINQQNGIINLPDQEHHQSSWHRDLPYQDYIISKPIAIACLICIDDFRAETGSTAVIPFSHQLEKIPSVNYIDNNKVSVEAKKGSAIVFNAMLYHQAGYNSSKNIRRGLNTLFTIPLLKQQIDLHSQLQGRYSEDPYLRRLLGYDSQVPGSVMEWRQNRLKK